MARQNPSDQVATLKKKQAALEAQLREAQAKADAEAKEKQRRKNELAGAVILKALDAMPSGHFPSFVRELLDSGLKTAGDRSLFGLPPRKKPDGAAETVGGKPSPELSGGAAVVAEMAENAAAIEAGTSESGG